MCPDDYAELVVKLAALDSLLIFRIQLASELEPIFAEDLDRVRRAYRAIAASKSVHRAELGAAPADSLRVLGKDW